MSIDVVVGDYPTPPNPFESITDAELAEVLMRTWWPILNYRTQPRCGGNLSRDEKLELEKYRHGQSFFLAGVAALQMPEENPMRRAFLKLAMTFEQQKPMGRGDTQCTFFCIVLTGQKVAAFGWLNSLFIETNAQYDLVAILAQIRAEAQAAIDAERDRLVARSLDH